MPEDLRHAKNVRKWVKTILPAARPEVLVAALAHDIERALPDRKVHRRDFADYDAFKTAHAENSAKIAREILDRYPLAESFKSRVTFLIRHHEFGLAGDAEVEALKDADAISFFDVNLPLYFRRSPPAEVLFRMQWGYRRLSQSGRNIVGKFRYEEPELNALLARVAGGVPEFAGTAPG